MVMLRRGSDQEIHRPDRLSALKALPSQPSRVDGDRLRYVQYFQFGDQLESLCESLPALIESPHEKLGEGWSGDGKPLTGLGKLLGLGHGSPEPLRHVETKGGVDELHDFAHNRRIFSIRRRSAPRTLA